MTGFNSAMHPCLSFPDNTITYVNVFHMKLFYLLLQDFHFLNILEWNR